MSDAMLERVIRLSEQLSPAERVALVRHVQATLPAVARRVTLDALKAKQAHLRATGAFAHPTSLANRWARPGLDLSFEEIETLRHDVGREWEQELEQFFGDQPSKRQGAD